jgi:hypothetical protein
VLSPKAQALTSQPAGERTIHLKHSFDFSAEDGTQELGRLGDPSTTELHPKPVLLFLTHGHKWPPVAYRIKSKVLGLAFKALS